MPTNQGHGYEENASMYLLCLMKSYEQQYISEIIVRNKQLTLNLHFIKRFKAKLEPE